MADQMTTVTYTISDGTREAFGEITITIREELKANPYILGVSVGSVTIFDPKINDVGPVGFQITAVSTPSLGSIRITEDNQLEYTAPTSMPS